MILWLTNCKPKETDTAFGKNYNSERLKYGSPTIHDYMLLDISWDSVKNWETPLSIQDTISIGYHSGKGYYIHPDSVIQEDDIYRKRISDTTFAYIGILTFGNIKNHRFRSIYYDTTCANSINLKLGSST